MIDVLNVLILILVANAAPVVASYVFKHRPSLPVDFGLKLKSGNCLLGPAKTWRGLVASLIATTLLSWLLLDNALMGSVIALLAMAGDLLTSFIKRRLLKPTSSRAVLLDQVPESLLPALGAKYFVTLDLIQVIVIVSSFIMLETVLSKPFYKLGIRKNPY